MPWPVGDIEDALLHRVLGGGSVHDAQICVIFYLTRWRPLTSLGTQICVIKEGTGAMLGLGSFRAAGSVLIGVAVMLSLGKGLRQSLGLFMPSLTRDLPVSVTDFTLAVAIQNLAWGALQPIAGAWVVRLGFRPVMVAGGALYAAGLATLATAQGALGVSIGAGVLIGLALACTASAIAMAVARGLGCGALEGFRHGYGRWIGRRADRGADRPGPY